jgi:hypothetical protein
VIPSSAAIDMRPSPVATGASTLEPIRKNISLAIYNDTKVADLANVTKSKIVDHIKDINIIKTGNSIDDYQETQLFDVSGKNTSLIKQIRALIDGTIISTLPEGEASAGADIVIFVGQ